MALDAVIVCQLDHFRFGDQRLNRRCQHLQTQLMQLDCAQSFPRLFKEKAQLKAFYRLVNNPKLTPTIMDQAYQQGLIQWANQQPINAPNKTLYAFQDTTVARFHGRKLDLGYVQNPDDNGLLLHHAILTDSAFVPLGLPVQEFIQRDRASYGKRHTHKERPFEEKESYKWVKALHFARHFSQQTSYRIVQVADAESDIAEWYNLALEYQQAFVSRSCQNRQLADKSAFLQEWLQEQPVGGLLCRPIRDAKGKVHELRCAVKWGLVALSGIAQPLTVIELRQVELLPDHEPSVWRLLTNEPVTQLAHAEEQLNVYTHRWRTCEDYHKCLKSGCGIETRQFESVEALSNSLRLLSLVAIRLLRLRDQSQGAISTTPMEWTDESEVQVATQLSSRYLSRYEQSELVPQSVGWFWQLLARLGGHQGVRQSGPPGWQTIWKGYTHFQTLVDGYRMSKNEYLKTNPQTCG